VSDDVALYAEFLDETYSGDDFAVYAAAHRVALGQLGVINSRRNPIEPV